MRPRKRAEQAAQKVKDAKAHTEMLARLAVQRQRIIQAMRDEVDRLRRVGLG